MNSSLKERILALPISAIADALDGYGVIDTSIMPLENDWILCRVENNVFLGDGDPDKLFRILEVFRQWAEKFQ